MRKLLLFFIFVTSLYSRSVDAYVTELKNLDKNQSMTMVMSYWTGVKSDFGLTLMAIVWKESSFGKNLSNTRDGKYGSFGVGQILLETAMRRLNKTSKADRKDVKMKLLTDTAFNLKLAMEELTYWRKYHKDKKKRKYWLTCVIASYNAGWKSVYSSKGKEYAKDVLVRIKALKKYFKTTKEFKHKVTIEHMKDIQQDLIDRGDI